jgi:hypothetical protein
VYLKLLSVYWPEKSSPFTNDVPGGGGDGKYTDMSNGKP